MVIETIDKLFSGLTIFGMHLGKLVKHLKQFISKNCIELFKKGCSISKAKLLVFRLDMQLIQCRVEETYEKSYVLLSSMFGVNESKVPVKKGLSNKTPLVIRGELTDKIMVNRRHRKIITRIHVHEEDGVKDDLFED